LFPLRNDTPGVRTIRKQGTTPTNNPGRRREAPVPRSAAEYQASASTEKFTTNKLPSNLGGGGLRKTTRPKLGPRN